MYCLCASQSYGYGELRQGCKWEVKHNLRGPLQGVKGSSPILVFPVQGTCTENTSPHNVWLWKSMGEPEGWGRQIPFLKESYTDSLALNFSTEAVFIKRWMQGLPRLCGGSSCQCRGHGFDPRSWKISHAKGQLSPCTTTTEAKL